MPNRDPRDENFCLYLTALKDTYNHLHFLQVMRQHRSSLALRPIGMIPSSFPRLLQVMRRPRSSLALRPIGRSFVISTTAPGHETAPFEPSSQTYRDGHFIISTTAPGHETAPFEPSSQTFAPFLFIPALRPCDNAVRT